VNFTREPIIETVITPREGCKLVVRSSKGNGQEDYIVDAVEVVSFGHSFFFRSQERPKSFLVPVSDYEILESKEARMVLKNVSTERSIKIGGGREAAPPRREEPPQDAALSESRPAPAQDPRQGNRDGNKRRRGRRGRDRQEPRPQDRPREPYPETSHEPASNEEAARNDFEESSNDFQEPVNAANQPVPEKAPSFISKLFPPPTTLIKDSLSRYKPSESAEGTFPAPEKSEETIFEHPTSEEQDDESEQ